MEVFDKRPFKVGEREFVTMAAHDKEPGSVRIWVQTKDGRLVVITFPDGSRATRSYTVSLEVRQDFAVITGIKAVDRLMDTAEADVRSDVEQGWA
jgi:hypothetical protein